MFYFMPFGIFFMFLFWIGLIVLAIWFVNKLSRNEFNSANNKPLDIVKTRYANGEITKKEFHEMQKELQI